MIGVRTPLRIGFVGGGTDLRSFYSLRAGCVVSMAINKFMHVVVRKSFNGATRLSHSKIEETDNAIRIEHPIVRRVLEKFDIQGIDITSIADVPPGTGLGSSSAFTVSLLHAVHAYLDHTVSKEDLAKEACEVEIDDLDGVLGKQDQYASAYGGLNFITFHPDESVTVDPIDVPDQTFRNLEESLLLFYVGGERSARTILADQQHNFSKSQGKFRELARLGDLTHDFRAALLAGRIDDCGAIMHEGWMLKREQSTRITTEVIDRCYDKGLKNGAWGGKLLGAGGGGFLAFLCPPEKRDAISAALGTLHSIPIALERKGTTLIFKDE